MKTLFISCFIFLLSYTSAYTQTLDIREVASVPKETPETSGLAVSSKGFWTINDSGNEPVLFLMDTAGVFLKSLRVSGAENYDWEELARDTNGNLYICDFGNNGNQRQDLKIYIINNPDNETSDSVSVAGVIEFKYPDQTAFPPVETGMYFDMEAAFWHNDSLYLFSKNRTKPFDGYTKMYRLPAQAGNYTAQLMDSIQTCTDAMFLCWITSADISPDGSRFALLSSDKVWMFKATDGISLKNPVLYQLPPASQKESIVFVTNRGIYITDELNQYGGGKLYKGSLKGTLP